MEINRRAERGVDVLIMQSKHWSPCMETAGEIALQLQDAGQSVGLCVLDANDPFEPPPWGIWPIQATKKRKAEQLCDMLDEKGVECVLRNAVDLASHEETAKVERVLAAAKDLKSFTYDGAPLGTGVLSELISSQADSSPHPAEHRSLVEGALAASISAYRLAEEAIMDFHPAKVAVYNARFAVEYAIVCAAKKTSIPLLCYELIDHEPPLKSKFWIGEGSLFELACIEKALKDFWSQGGENKTAVATEFFTLQRKGRIGSFNYVKLQTKNSRPDKRKKRRIAFFTSSDDEIACMPFEDCVGQSDLFETQREAALFLIDWVRKQADVELVIRVHPHVSVKHARERAFWNALAGDNVTLIRSDAETDSYALMESSDLVVSYCSTVGIEATFWGVPSVGLAKASYSGLGCIYQPSTIPELVELLECGARPLSPATALPYGYFWSAYGRDYRYYDPLSGGFCGEILSMDLPAMRMFKESALGKTLKRGRDVLAARRRGMERLVSFSA